MKTIFTLAVLLVLSGLAGCKGMSFGKAGVAPAIVAAQAPGVATGAGATLTGPNNSSTPSRQIATRRVGYQPLATVAQRLAQTPPRALPPTSVQPSIVLAPPPPPELMPAWTEETTDTTIGAHQDAAGIVKMAAELGEWGKGRWLGCLLLFAAYSGLLWSHNNDATGYPVVWIKVGAIGAGLVVLDPSPWWLLLLLIPALFYLAQKLGLLRLPLP